MPLEFAPLPDSTSRLQFHHAPRWRASRILEFSVNGKAALSKRRVKNTAERAEAVADRPGARSNRAVLKWTSASDIPESPGTHKLIMGLAVGLPFAGCLVAAALLWQWGFMGWLHVVMLVGGWF